MVGQNCSSVFRIGFAAERCMIARDSDGATQVGAAAAEGGMIARDGDRAVDLPRGS